MLGRDANGYEPGMLATGEILDGRYQLERLVATGGAGQVWQARDTVLQRQVAIKILRDETPGRETFAARFLDEARTMAALHHPGVVDVYDYGEIDGVAYLVMAYVEGEPLNEFIASRGRLTPAETMPIIANVANALEVVHQAGIIHRDIKPGNLILQEDGSVVLVDFGIARQPQATHLTAADEVIGTPLYIAPEQVSRQPVTPAVDVYALGAVAYHCLAGRPPFPGDNPIAVAIMHLSEDPQPLPEDVPAPVQKFVATAMAKDPTERFSSAAAMAEAAEATPTSADRPLANPVRPLVTTAPLQRTTLLPGPPLLPSPSSPATPTPPRSIDRRILAALGISALALLAMVGLLFRSDPLPSNPGGPVDPRPGPTESVAPGVPAGSTGDGGSAPEGSAEPGPSDTPEPSGAPTSPGVATTPAPTTQPQPTEPPTAEPTTQPAETPIPPSPFAVTTTLAVP
jgi:serine/threonine protein kinase